jgi:hypothetical protein
MSDNYTPWASGAAPASWSEVVWPDWVPLNVREQIESFWSASYNRCPADYEKSASSSYNGGLGRAENIPFFGDLVTLPGWSPGEVVTGRWVHAWNNIGRLVTADGTVRCVSTCYYRRVEK